MRERVRREGREGRVGRKRKGGQKKRTVPTAFSLYGRSLRNRHVETRVCDRKEREVASCQRPIEWSHGWQALFRI